MLDHKEIVAAEVYTKKQHKYSTYILDIRAVPSDTVVFDTKSSGTCRTHRSTYRFKKRHASE